MDAHHDTSTMAVKAGLAWIGVGLSYLGIEKWSDFAAMLASLYTVILICEWIYKRIKHRPVR